jgi:Sulfotransferase domain
LKILVACFPKSGSTFLSTLIGNLPGFSPVLYTPAYGRREQELSEAEIERASSISRQVAQVHVRASEYTLYIIDKFNMKPIVLVRDIYDTAVSLAEHVANEPTMPMAYFDAAIAGWSFEDRLSAVFDLAMPWYFNFYVSWRRARPYAIVTYEDLILGDAGRQTEYLNSIGLDTNITDVRSAIKKIQSLDTRLNVGKSGRGVRAIGTRHRRQIERLASYYPDEDFSHIGIRRKIGNKTVQSGWEALKAGASHLVRRL